MVVYQIYPRSFQDSDGDGLGDLPGVTQRLDHLAWLGVDALWLSPIHPSPMADGGYDVADYTTIDPAFGTDGDFDALVARAHALGLKVLLDLVPCHTSIEHPWFSGSPQRYIWSPTDAAPNNWRSNFGGSAWSPDPQGRGVYLHSFYPEQPDLDWRNPEVPAAFADILGGWRARGVDGFRLDALQRLSKDAQLRDEQPRTTPSEVPLAPEIADLQLRFSGDADGTEAALGALRAGAGADAILVGEVFVDEDRMPRYLPHVDAVFGFGLFFSPFDAPRLAEAIRRAPAGQTAWVLGNHDFSRPATRLGPRAARAMAVLALLLPGIACLYQGDELGLQDGPGADSTRPPYDRYGRDPFRHPMPWQSGASHLGFSDATPWLEVQDAPRGAVDVQREDPGSTLNLHRDLLRLRRELGDAPLESVEARGQRLHVVRGDVEIVVDTAAQTARILRT